ncbi:aspartyl-phosphate phosphatase Spo0E family protein [Jeotgalibacillus soli]|uniref:aspartyl-phosphate phosphatase Spo0E family protein n=1 Tax=Jeotgalibacillus soli TaxID=889306 RepID=UPI000D08C49D|nr:aspartyl-phosphate phosphatase Spo0E family protein [Jeotgalibacillus soli]
MEELIRLIELKKNKLSQIAKKGGLTNQTTVQCSQELDILLNTHQKIDQNIKQKNS